MLNDLPTERVTAALRFGLTEAHLSRERLALKVGYSSSAVSRRLTGEVPLTLEDLEVFAGAIGLSVSITLTPTTDTLKAAA